jgi:hypothetical protein
MVFSQNRQSYTAILETRSSSDEMEDGRYSLSQIQRLDNIIRRIRDNSSDRVWMLISEIIQF